MRRNRGICGLALVCLFLGSTSPVQAGATFYLTVERSFEPQEQPELRLDFVDAKTPLKVRILKPKNRREFLTNHRLISRAYQEPRVGLNPAHYLLQGLPYIEAPWRLVRDMIAKDYRYQNLATINQPLYKIPAKPLTRVPDLFAIEPSSSLEKVKELYFDLAGSGQQQQDQVPGFEDWLINDDGRYQQLVVKLPKLPAGIYLIQGIQGHNEAQALLQISDLHVIVKQSTFSLTAIVQDAASTKPIEGVKVSSRNNQGQWQSLGSTDRQGLLHYTGNDMLASELLVEVASDQHFGLVATQFLSSALNKDSLFLFTDRPIFKPGETLYYKGITGTGTPAKGWQAPLAIDEIRLYDQDRPVVISKSVENLSAQGSFSGEIAIPQEASPGLYRLEASGNQSVYQGELRVRDYQKPTFFVKSLEEQGQLRPGHTFRLQIKAERYAGGIAPQARYEVFVYRSPYSEPTWISDAGVGLKTGHDYFGQTRSTASYGLPELLYSSLDQRHDQEPSSVFGFSGTWASAPSFDGEGNAWVEVMLSAETQASVLIPYTYSLVVKARDIQGSAAVLRKSYPDLPSGFVIQIQPESKLIDTDEPVVINVHSRFPDGRSAANLFGSLKWQTEGKGATGGSQRFETDAEGRARLLISEINSQNAGKWTFTAIAEGKDGNPLVVPVASASQSLLIPGDGTTTIGDPQILEIQTKDSMVAPGTIVKIVALLPEGWGQDGSNKGLVYQTLTAEKVLSVTPIEVSGRTWIHTFKAPSEAGLTGFHYNLTVPIQSGQYREQHLAFHLLAKDRILDIAIQAPTKPVEPFSTTTLAFQVNDGNGQPAAGVELAVSIVDEAVFAIQAEIRPSILSFFFPVPPFDLSSFLNRKLRGYGYADTIRNPNFSFASLKERTVKAPHRAKDTAGFFPHLVTDASGHVQVDLALPENQTLWRVTAIANDGTGRFGESQGSFRSQAQFEFRLASPSFVRTGDRLRLPLTFVNRTDQAQSAQAQLTSSQAHFSPESFDTVPLKPQSELTIQTNYEFKAPAGSDTSPALMPAHQIELRANVVDQVAIKTFYDVQHQPKGVLQHLASPTVLTKGTSDDLQTVLPQDSSLQKLVVTMSPGAYGLARRAAPYLISYPYGCTEQLVSSTTPNLVYLELIPHPQTPLETKTYNQALIHGQRGLTMILARQEASGGFRMWPSDNQASIAATVLALDLLVQAEVSGLATPRQAVSRARDWLKEQWQKHFGDRPLPLSSSGEGLLTMRWAAQSYQLARVLQELWQNQPGHPALQLITMEAIGGYSFYDSMLSDDQKQQTIAAMKAILDNSDQASLAQPVRHYLERPSPLPFPTHRYRLFAGALQVLHRFQALDDATKTRGLNLLAEGLKSGYWQSTFDSAQIIQSLKPLIKDEIKRGQLSSEPPQIFNLNDQPLTGVEKIYGGYQLVMEQGQLKDLGLLRIKGLSQNFWVSADYHIYTENPVADSAFAVERQLYVVAGGPPKALDPGASIPEGATVVSLVKIRKNTAHFAGSWPGSQLIILEDPVPSFAASIEEDREFLSQIDGISPDMIDAIKETRRYQNRVDRVLSWPTGRDELIIGQVWQGTYEGLSSLPPASVRMMYDETQVGFSPAQVLQSGAVL